jgi:M6 family metalloprotease-like protein
MCIICVSTISIASLIAPSHAPDLAPAQSLTQVSIQTTVVNNKKSTSGYEFTNKSCSKSNLNKVKNNTICLKNGKVYRWAKIKTATTPNPNPTTNKTIVYQAPTKPSANVELCKVKESNRNRENAGESKLPTGFPGNTIAKKTGTVKWALIPLDFPDLAGEENFRSRVDDQMKLLSDWFATVSEGNFKVEWVVAKNWVRLPKPTNEYRIDRSDNLDRAPNGLKLWNDAMSQSDKTFDFTGIQTVNFILPKGQNFINESSQGFPWDAGVKNLVTGEGSVSSYSIPGKFFDSDKRQYWSYWAHEFGHAMAIPHVGSSREPNQFMGLDIMGNQDGESKDLSGWLRFVSGWLADERVYCKQLSELENTEITLVPLNDSASGVKMVVVPVSQTKAVVIESRREGKFSCPMPSKRNGVLAYIYDATLSHGENFLKPLTPAGRAIEYASSCPVAGYPNPILYKGQKIVAEGLSIEIMDSLNYDKIRINRGN